MNNPKTHLFSVILQRIIKYIYMLDQKSREILYFKVPVFVMDLAIHLVTLAVLLVWHETCINC